MADIDIDPFGGMEHPASREHDRTESRPDEPTDEHIPLIPGERGVLTWEPIREQVMSFGGEKTKEDLVQELYLKPFKHLSLAPEEFHFDDFELRDGRLYYKGVTKSLTKRGGELRTVKELADILGKKRLNKLSFSIPRGNVTIRQATVLKRVKEELPSTSAVNEVDDIDLQETVKSVENLISQMSQTDDSFEGEETLPM